jgi:uncharacterized protein (DUF302 family)
MLAQRKRWLVLKPKLKAHGMTVFARINHATLAERAGMALRPTEVILFGNPRGGTPLMQANQTIGIDLPLKALVWQGASGKTWLSYNQPEWLAKRHGVAGAERVVAAMDLALSTIAANTTKEATTNSLSVETDACRSPKPGKLQYHN